MIEVDHYALRTHLDRRLSGLKSERSTWEPHWRRISTQMQPRRSRFLTTEVNRGDKINNLNDDRPAWAAGVLGNGMASGCSSASRPWLKIGLQDADLAEWGPAKQWLDGVEQYIYQVFASTNFYAASKAGYYENGLFGSECAVMLEHPTRVATFHPLTAGEYFLWLDEALAPAGLMRWANMTVDQYTRRFPRRVWSSWVKTAYDQSNYEQWVTVWHAIEPNPAPAMGKLDAAGMGWRSVYWEDAGKSGPQCGILEVGGHREKPFWAARWETIGADVYGHSPGMVALSQAETLALLAMRKAQMTDYLYRPPLGVPAAAMRTRWNLNPGGRTALPAGGADARPMPLWEINPSAIAETRNDQQDAREAVDRAFSVDLFLAITNMRGVQPRNIEEIARRNEEKLTQLGPVVERIFDEKLTPAVDRVFAIGLRNGMIPPPPRDLEGQALKLRFVSVLAQAQQMIGLGAIERTVGMVGNLVAAFPQVADKLDVDQVVDEFASIAGAPAKIIRSDEDVAVIRQQRAAQDAAQQQLAAMPAVRDGADAARLLAETQTNDGASLLDRIVGAA